jgi:hypothetical protein
MFSRQIYLYSFHIFKFNNLKVIYDLYSQCLIKNLSKTTFFIGMEGVSCGGHTFFSSFACLFQPHLRRLFSMPQPSAAPQLRPCLVLEQSLQKKPQNPKPIVLEFCLQKKPKTQNLEEPIKILTLIFF